MNVDEFINRAIKRLESEGLASLEGGQRLVGLISEAEVSCDKDGIESLILKYSKEILEECSEVYAAIGATEIAAAFKQLSSEGLNMTEKSLKLANELICSRRGYDYEAIASAIRRRGDSDWEAGTVVRGS